MKDNRATRRDGLILTSRLNLIYHLFELRDDYSDITRSDEEAFKGNGEALMCYGTENNDRNACSLINKTLIFL